MCWRKGARHNVSPGERAEALSCGRAVAAQQLCCVKIVNLGQSVLQLGKDSAGRLPVDLAMPPNASGT